jgi:hypothetical protein
MKKERKKSKREKGEEFRIEQMRRHDRQDWDT